MSKVLIFALFSTMAVAVLSAPADDYNFQPEEASLYQERDLFHPDQEFIHHEDGSVRLPRATCDLLSAFGVADSACAAHCLAKRFKGGWCEQGVCHCRR